jgi:hypothetical protein
MSSQRGGGVFGPSDKNYGSSYNYGRQYSNYVSDSGVSSGVIQYVYYFIIITIIILIILVIINYTFYPIFRTRPGAKGIIPLPGTDDSKQYWTSSKTPTVINDMETPIGKNFENWSYIMDIQIDNPTANTGMPRILMARGGDQVTQTGKFTEADTILRILPTFNTAVYLDALTNDLFVSIQTLYGGSAVNKQPLVETIRIQNIPIRKSVRIGVMIGSKVLEVYINGYLVRTKTFTVPLRDIGGYFYPPSEKILSNTARVKNLRIWNRPLSPAEFRSYGRARDFDIKDIPDSCAA